MTAKKATALTPTFSLRERGKEGQATSCCGVITSHYTVILGAA